MLNIIDFCICLLILSITILLSSVLASFICGFPKFIDKIVNISSVFSILLILMIIIMILYIYIKII